MDTFLAIASRREVREYEGKPIPDDLVRRILDAGRLSGSGSNRQPWRFVLVSGQAQEPTRAAHRWLRQRGVHSGNRAGSTTSKKPSPSSKILTDCASAIRPR